MLHAGHVMVGTRDVYLRSVVGTIPEPAYKR